VNLAAPPFSLDAAAISWVQRTRAKLSTDEKIGQLFCLLAWTPDLDDLDAALEIVAPGGYFLRPAAAADVRCAHLHLQRRSRVPLLLAANLERGGNGIALEGTEFASPLAVAATGDEEHAYRLGLVCGREARAVGSNWSFSPLVDIDLNPQNPITGTRVFGSDPAAVARLAAAYIRGVHEAGVAATAKHWPGDGVDYRDQHLLTTVNSLAPDMWDANFGRVFRHVIAVGVDAVMAGHIMQPQLARELEPDIADDRVLPASLSAELTTKLLRGRLRFNGLVVSDATPMVGFTAALPRVDAVPGCIAAGCDMILFTVNLAEDVEFMRRGLERGVLSKERLDEAVTRVLGLKASLGLHEQQRSRTLVPAESELSIVGCSEHQAWAREAAGRAITLVRDVGRLLPLDLARYRRILLYGIATNGDPRGIERFAERLRERGFDVTRFSAPDDAAERLRLLERPLAERRKAHDLVLYYAAVETLSNQTTARINWLQPMALDAPRFVHELPTVFVSVDNPYHLQDVPHVGTFVNAYSGTPAAVDELVARLLGEAPFSGRSPVDPTCGLWDAARGVAGR
jgi:beta-N-acetylhexosaminidase